MEKKIEKEIIEIIIVVALSISCIFYFYDRFYSRFYESLAWGLRSETSRETSNYLLIFVIFLLIVHLVRTWRKISSRIKNLKKPGKTKKDDNKIQYDLSPEIIRTIRSGDYEEARKKHKEAKRLIIFQSLSDLVFFFFIAAVLSIPYSQEFYRKHLIAVFRQKFTAAKVLMDDQEESLILDKVREIESKQDYLDIINELQQTIDNEVQGGIRQNPDKKVTIKE